MSFLLFKTIFTIIILLLVTGFTSWCMLNKGGKNEDTWFKIALGSLKIAAVLLIGLLLGVIWLS